MGRLYKIRKITSNNQCGDAHGITIPNEIHTNFKETSFNILNGGSQCHQIEIKIIDEINNEFKKMSIEIPSEFYPQLKVHQLQIRTLVKDSLSELNTSIILSSGCKI